MELHERLRKTAEGTASFLKGRLEERRGWGARSFYGEAFSIALLQRCGLLDERSRILLLSLLAGMDRTDPEFHWEFNDYALQDYREVSGDEGVDPYLEPLRFKGTTVANWSLLRSLVKVRAGGAEALEGLAEAQRVLRGYQMADGLIQDQSVVRSFQYHCFSMALVGELAVRSGQEPFWNAFRRALDFIRPFILRNGEFNYVGRGQKQSFGYGALIHALALGYAREGDKTLLSDLDRVLSHLEGYKRPDGSFPLVLNGLEQGIPEKADASDPRYTGWYPYNNYFDYLPFLGFFLHKAAALLEGGKLPTPAASSEKEFQDNRFRKVVRARYEAVLSRCGGYWTNDLAMPYIVAGGKALTPCYGGEQFQRSIYDLSGLPLPEWGPFRTSFRRLMRHRFDGDRMTFLSPGGYAVRDFEFGEERIRIRTRVWSPFSIRHLYLFLGGTESLGDRVLRSGKLRVTSDRPFESLGTRYSASGSLRLYGVRGRDSRLEYEVEP